MKNIIAAVALTALLAAPAFAEDQIDPARMTLAREVMQLSGATKNYDKFETNLDAVVAQMTQGTPDADPATIADIKKIAMEEYSTFKPEMMEGAVKIYARHFSEADLKALIAFYKSEAGQHFAAELPAVSSECIQLNVPFSKHFIERVKKYIADKVAAAKAEQEKSKGKQ